MKGNQRSKWTWDGVGKVACVVGLLTGIVLPGGSFLGSSASAQQAPSPPPPPPAPAPSGPTEAEMERYSRLRLATDPSPLQSLHTFEAGLTERPVRVRKRGVQGNGADAYETRSIRVWETPPGMELMAWEGSYMPETFRPVQGGPYKLGYRMQMGALPAWVPPSLFSSGPDIGSSTEPLVPAGLGGKPTGWQGKSRATLEGMVDLMTGTPLIKRTDLELPVGQSVFRFNRTRSSMHGTSFSTFGTILNKGVFDATDRMWDWAGLGWMISENPILLIDDARPDEVGAGARTTWLVLDAHRSIPFQWIEDLGRYEGVPRFGATLTFTETYEPNSNTKIMGRRGQRWETGATAGAGIVDAPTGWEVVPSEWKVSMYGGALTYTFTLIPDNQIKHQWNPSIWLNPTWPPNRLLDSTMHDRPFLGEDLPNNFNSGGYVWSNANTTNLPGQSAQPGYGVPHLAILTKIEGQCGTVIDLHYAKVRQRPMDWNETTSLFEMHQDALSVGQLKYLTIRMSPTARDGKGGPHPQAGQIVWTAMYSHRHFVGVHSEASEDFANTLGTLWPNLRGYPWFMGGNAPESNDHTWWRRTMQGFSAIDRIYVYEGELPADVLAHEMVTAAIDPEDADEADDLAQLNAPLDRFIAKHSLASHQGKLQRWRYAIRHDYNKPGDLPIYAFPPPPSEPGQAPPQPWAFGSSVDGAWPWWEPQGPTLVPQAASGPVGPPMLVMTSVFEQPALPTNQAQIPAMERRNRSVVIYDLPGWYTFAGPGSLIASRPQANPRGSWELPWVTAILDEADIERVLRASWKPEGDEGVLQGEYPLVGSLGELVYQRRTSGPLIDQVFSDRRREEIMRLASVQFASSLGQTWRDSHGPGLASMYSPSMESLWVTGDFGQYVRTGTGDAGVTGFDSRAFWDGHVATVGDISIGGDGRTTEVIVGEGTNAAQTKAGNRGYHARIHRYVRTPGDASSGFDQHVYRQRNEGAGHPANGPALASVFLHPFRWHAFRALDLQGDADQALTAPPDGEGLRTARFVVVVDEFEDRASMRAGVPTVTPRHGAPSPDLTSLDPATAYGSVQSGGLKKGMVARTVYEINPWGYVLRQRRWDFRDGQATQTVQGIGEEYHYKTMREVLGTAVSASIEQIAQPPQGVSLADWPVPSPTALLEQIVVAEKRSVGWSVAAGDGSPSSSNQGTTEGLIEVAKYEVAKPQNGDANALAEQLSRYGWSDRIRLAAVGIQRGTSGSPHYQTQRFYDSGRVNELIAEVRFNRPRKEGELLAAPPSAQELLNLNQAEAGYQVTLHRFQLLHGQPAENPASILAWRQRIDPPVQQTPGGPWYFPTEKRYLTGDHQNPYTVTALLRNPFTGPDLLNSDPDEMVIWSVQYTNGRGQPDTEIADSWIGSPTGATSQYIPFLDSEFGGESNVEVGYPSWDLVPGLNDSPVNVEPWPRRPGRWGADAPMNRVVKYSYDGEDHQLTDRIERGRRYAVRTVKDEGDPEVEGDEVSYEYEFPVLKPLARAEPTEANPNPPQMYEVLEPVRIRKRAGLSIWGPIETEQTVRFIAPVQLKFTYETRPMEGVMYEEISRREYGLDVHGRPVAMEELERTLMPNGTWTRTRSGGGDVYDLGEVIRRWDYAGNVQRWTRDYLGLRYRRYEGVADYLWGLEGRVPPGENEIQEHQFDPRFTGYDMVLKERTEYGQSPSDIWQPVREYRYLSDDRDSWAHVATTGGVAGDTGGYHNPVPANVKHDAYLTRHGYDWRGRRVRSDLYDLPGTAVPGVTAIENRQRRRTTLRYLDGAGREYMTAEFGLLMPGSLPDEVDPTRAGVIGSQTKPQDLLALSPRPVSIVERRFDAGDRVIETRNWRVDGPWAPHRYTATFSFYGPGGEIFTHSGEGAARRMMYDPLGRVSRTASVVNRGQTPWAWELERTDSTFDERDNVIVEERYERVLDQGDQLDATNAVRRVVHRWYDSADRKIAEVDYGTGATAGGLTVYMNGSAVSTRPVTFSMALLPAYARSQQWKYNQAGQLIESIDADGIITTYGYTGSKLTRTSVNSLSAPNTVDPEQRTQTQKYYHGKLVSQSLIGQFGDLQPQPAQSPRMEASNVYGAPVVDSDFAIQSWDRTKVRYMGRLGAMNQVAPAPLGDPTREFEFRYDFVGRVAERISADGLVMRYRYTAEDELASIEVGHYQGTTFMPGYGGRLIAADTIGFVEFTTTVTPGPEGESLKTRTATARTRRIAIVGDPSRVISQVVQNFDAEGRLISEQQAIGATVTAATPRIDYVRSAERVLPNNQGLASQQLTEMIYPQIREYDRRRVVFAYGQAGSIDQELGRVTSIGTKLTPSGTTIPLANYEFGGMDRRVRTVLGGLQHGVERSLRSKPLGATDVVGVGYAGVDGFGRERVASYTRVTANANATGEELLKLEYTFDRHNRISWQHLSFGSAAAPGERPWHRGYRYDKLGRLVESAIGNVVRGATETEGWSVGSTQLTRRDRWHLDAADNWSLVDPMWNAAGASNEALPGGRIVTTWGTGMPSGGVMASFRQSHLWSGDLAMMRVGLDGTLDPPSSGNQGPVEYHAAQGVQRDAAGRVESDGRQYYIYDAWGRLTQVSEADVDTAAPIGVTRWKPGKLIRHLMYDAYGRLIRVQRRANSLEEDPNLEIVSSERMYYDGVRRVTEVVSAPVLSKLASDGTIEVPDPIEAESGDEPDEKTANATFENVQLLSNELEIAVEYVWDVEGPVDTLLAYFGGTGYASAYGEGSSQRSEAWFVIQDQTGDPVAVLSAPMGSTPSGAPSLPMRIAWRGVFCNTGGVVFSQDHSWQMPALRIGHKGLHVERLDVLAYLFNRTYWPERFQIGTGRTNAQEIASRNAGASQTPSGWTPHPRDHSADLLILMRNRAMIASHGRFLQPDPNATGLPVMGDLSFGGSALSPPRVEVDLSTWTTDGLNVLAYCSGDSVNRSDPLGLAWDPFSMVDEYLAEDAASKAAFLRGVTNGAHASAYLVTNVLSWLPGPVGTIAGFASSVVGTPAHLQGTYLHSMVSTGNAINNMLSMSRMFVGIARGAAVSISNYASRSVRAAMQFSPYGMATHLVRGIAKRLNPEMHHLIPVYMRGLSGKLGTTYQLSRRQHQELHTLMNEIGRRYGVPPKEAGRQAMDDFYETANGAHEKLRTTIIETYEIFDRKHGTNMLDALRQEMKRQGW